MRYTIIAPHLDDGVLSCGELIAKLVDEKHDVQIATIFTGTPDPKNLSSAARQYHNNCYLGDDAMRVRKEEDVAACHYLGCSAKHFNAYECLYRRNSEGAPIYPSLDNIYYLSTEDNHIVEDVYSLLKSYISEFDIAFAPLGLGRHADHLAVNTAMRLVEDRELCKVLYYEEVPYICYENEELHEEPIHDMRPVFISLTEQNWIQKKNAVSFYASQLHIMWKNEETRNAQLRFHVYKGRHNPMLRLWERMEKYDSKLLQ